MAADKNLFRCDLAVAAILKNEGHYIKEWLDYHLLAGVGHFYLYDNDSTDDYAEIIAPYEAAGLVTSKTFSGASMQFAAYNDAVQNYRFSCRRMAFIDLDEFIYPKVTTESISARLDSILKNFPAASGLAINWQLFGSNNLQTADYSRGVLERFTRRAPDNWVVPIPKRTIPGGNAQVKTIANPRRIFFFTSAHFPIYFEGSYSVNENGGRVDSYCNNPVTVNKIAINHYNVKSRAEFRHKLNRGRADKAANYFNAEWFDLYDRNEIFDNGILTYRAARAENFSLESDEKKFRRMKDALIKTLSLFADDKISDMETALTCRAVSNYLQEKFFEEASLGAILKSLDGISLSDARLFLSELPNLLRLPYPVVNELRGASIQVISQLKDFMREHELWRDFAELDYLQRVLR